MLDKTIQYTFINGNLAGIKFLEFTKGDLIGIFIPRKLFNKDLEKINYLKNLLHNAGIYFLIGDKIYIGQAIDLFKRLEGHIRKEEKEFKDIVIFTTTNNSFDEGDINFLEKSIIEIAKNVGDNNLTNLTNGNKTNIKEFRKSDLIGYIEEIKFLLKVLGYDFMEEKVRNDEFEKGSDNLFFIKRQGLEARMVYNENGYIVLKGSTGKADVKPSLTYKKLRYDLIKDGVIKVNKDKIIFTKDYIFSSPSAAAQIILGYSVSGPDYWKDEKGKTLKEVEQQENEI